MDILINGVWYEVENDDQEEARRALARGRREDQGAHDHEGAAQGHAQRGLVSQETVRVLSRDKDVENRRWTTSYRGPFLVHAAMGMSERDYLDAWEWVESRFGRVVWDRIPARDALVRGAIVGRAVIVDVVPPDLGMDCPDPWHMGAQYGFRLHDRSAIPVPVHHRGGLGLRKLDLAKAEAMWPGTREWARRATASVVRPGCVQ